MLDQSKLRPPEIARRHGNLFRIFSEEAKRSNYREPERFQGSITPTYRVLDSLNIPIDHIHFSFIKYYCSAFVASATMVRSSIICSLPRCSSSSWQNSNCSQANSCYEYRAVSGGSVCAPESSCTRLDPCDGQGRCASNVTVCIVNSCCPQPVCFPVALIDICSLNGYSMTGELHHLRDHIAICIFVRYYFNHHDSRHNDQHTLSYIWLYYHDSRHAGDNNDDHPW